MIPNWPPSLGLSGFQCFVLAVDSGPPMAIFHVHNILNLGPRELLEVAADPAVAQNMYISKDDAGPLDSERPRHCHNPLSFPAPEAYTESLCIGLQRQGKGFR